MKLKFTRHLIAAAVLLAAGGTSFAVERHHGQMQPEAAVTGEDFPKQGGQSAFAAIAEIVALLEADPETDWSAVDIAGLREHLVDMNALTLSATAEQSEQSGAMVFTIRGTGPTVRAIQAMVPAHALELNKVAGWSVSAETTQDGAILRVKPDNSADLTRIRALGFFGLMATGAHHQPHHLAIAKGAMRH
uniref:hypothetical protein n=1 Tax=Pararhizobium sp. IMCC3301 TaxID=3067904 RepID=UPI002740C004|nr:hypothetical protein [Pararhizobium sp. IMCC3301]